MPAESGANSLLGGPGTARSGAAPPIGAGSRGLEHLGGSPCPAPARPGPRSEGGGERPRLAAGSGPRLFCTPCNVALVTLAPFPPHGFSESPAAPPPPCASALAARRGPAGESRRPRAHVTPPPCSAVRSQPRRDALARVPQASRSSEGRSLASCCRIRPPPRPGEGQPGARCVRAGRRGGSSPRRGVARRGAGSAAGPRDGGREGGGEEGSRILGSGPGGWAAEAG